MHLLVVLAVAIAISAVAPRLADALAAVVTFGFILPFFTFGGGGMAWAVLTLMGVPVPFLACCALFGLPMGVLMARFVYS